MSIVIQKSASKHPNARKYELMDNGLREGWYDTYGEALAGLERLCEDIALTLDFEMWKKYDEARVRYRELEDVA